MPPWPTCGMIAASKTRRRRSTAANGPSIHDAADAIEETEHRRRATAQEAQRRALVSGAAERARLWHNVNLSPDATLMESGRVYIAYSETQGTKMVRAGKSADLKATWRGGGRFTALMTLAAANFTTTTEMSVRTSGYLDNGEIDEFSMDTAGQTVYPEGKRAAVQFLVDEGKEEHTLLVHAENVSDFDIELGLEVNGVRQVPMRSPFEEPFAP